MNRFLLDTHLIIWTIYESHRLPEKVKDIMMTSANYFYYSQISTWEMAIKHIKLPKEFTYNVKEVIDDCKNYGIHQMGFERSHVIEYEALYTDDDIVDKDPFDRMLIAQANASDMTLLTHDKKMAACNLPWVKYV